MEESTQPLTQVVVLLLGTLRIIQIARLLVKCTSTAVIMATVGLLATSIEVKIIVAVAAKAHLEI